MIVNQRYFGSSTIIFVKKTQIKPIPQIYLSSQFSTTQIASITLLKPF
jgi:hypothetical protein